MAIKDEAILRNLEKLSRIRELKGTAEVSATDSRIKTNTKATRGVGLAAGGGKGGIAGPLEEENYIDREYHDSVDYLGTDGLILWRFEPLAYMKMKDANGNDIEFFFDEPPE